MAKEDAVHVGDMVINLKQILYARQNSQTGEVDIFFGVNVGESLKLSGDDAKAFWEFYSKHGTTTPGARPFGWMKTQQ